MSARHETWEEAVIWLKAQPDQAELVQACFFDDPRDFHGGEFKFRRDADYELRGVTNLAGWRLADQ